MWGMVVGDSERIKSQLRHEHRRAMLYSSVYPINYCPGFLPAISLVPIGVLPLKRFESYTLYSPYIVSRPRIHAFITLVSVESTPHIM